MARHRSKRTSLLAKTLRRNSTRQRAGLVVLALLTSLVAMPGQASASTASAAAQEDLPGCAATPVHVRVEPGALQGMDFSETRAKGHYKFTVAGLKIWTDEATGLGKVAGYIPTDFALVDAGVPAFSYVNSTGTPTSLQLLFDPDGNTGNATLANLVYEPTYYGENYWSNGNFGTGPGAGYNSYGTLEQYVAANPNGRVKAVGFSLGSGVLGSGTLQSLTAGCKIYDFAFTPIAPCASVTTTAVTTENANLFDYSQTRATGHYQFTPTGLKVYTQGAESTDKVAGYTAVSIPLGNIGIPSADYQAITGTAGASLQLGFDKNGDGVWDGYLVYEPASYGVGNFWSSKDFGVGPGMGYLSFGTLNDYWGVNPNAKIVEIGFSLGSGVFASGVLSSLTAGCTKYAFGYNPITSCATTANVAVTPGNPQGFDYSETRTQGHYSYTATGLNIYTDAATTFGKVAGYVPVNYPLADLGVPSVNYTLTSGTAKASLQIGFDRDGNGTRDAYLVYEPDFYGVGNYWATSYVGVPAGLGYQSFGTLDDFRGANPNGKVTHIGFSLGSGVLASGVLHSLTVGCKKYSFTADASTVVLTAGDFAAGSTIAPSVVVSSASGGSLAGAVKLLTASGTELGTGTVNAAGTGTITSSPLMAGDYQVKATYAGNANALPAESAVKALRVYFNDYAPGSQFFDEVQWLATNKVTGGSNAAGTNFGPGQAIERQALATWLYRLEHDGADAPACTAKPFTDVQIASQFCGEIKWLKDEEVTAGYANGSFHPADPISRSGLSAWFYRLGTNNAPTTACTVKPFTDVAMSNSAFCPEITWLRDQGITNGYANNTFRPGDPIKRDAVAAWIYRFANPA